jgi:hypothetical protein
MTLLVSKPIAENEEEIRETTVLPFHSYERNLPKKPKYCKDIAPCRISSTCTECFKTTRNHFSYGFLIFRLYIFDIYETIILPMVLYVCETWPLTLREEHKLRVFENRVLRYKYLYRWGRK